MKTGIIKPQKSITLNRLVVKHPSRNPNQATTFHVLAPGVQQPLLNYLPAFEAFKRTLTSNNQAPQDVHPPPFQHTHSTYAPSTTLPLMNEHITSSFLHSPAPEDNPNHRLLLLQKRINQEYVRRGEGIKREERRDVRSLEKMCKNRQSLKEVLSSQS